MRHTLGLSKRHWAVPQTELLNPATVVNTLLPLAHVKALSISAHRIEQQTRFSDEVEDHSMQSRIWNIGL